MEVKKAYNLWAEQYDTNENKTRDLEALALQDTLQNINIGNCLEIGCGTGKNTAWLIQKATTIKAIDLSNNMLEKAKHKIQSNKVQFIQADINEEWNFAKSNQFNLATFSLVLEHIQNLNAIFRKLEPVMCKKGYVYIGELHPFKQYSGTKARFETETELHIVTCFNHNISDFTGAAKQYGFEIIEVKEYFDDDDRTNIPRILALLIRKK